MADHHLGQELKLSSADAIEKKGETVTGCQEPANSIKLVASDEIESTGALAPENADLDLSNGALPGVSSVSASLAGNESAAEPIRVGNFVLGQELGCGTLGKVYHATNVHAEGEFALKLLSPEYCHNAAAADNLLEGLKAASGIANLHLSAYYECGKTDESIYLVTDCIKGKTLKDNMHFGDQFNSERFIDILRQVCQALKSLHQNNVVHGNIKPSNIFLLNSEDKGHDFAKLVDFGIIGGLNEEQKDEFLRKSCSEPGLCVNYMSPEQCLGYALDGRSDIYSLGLVMYEMLTGTPLVTGHSKMHAVMKQLNVRPRSIREIRKDVPASVEKIIMKCLEKNRASRYFSITDLELDLDLAAAESMSIPGLEANHRSQHGDDKAKEKSPREQRIKLALSAVICAGVLSCIAAAISNVAFPRLNPHQYVPPDISRTWMPPDFSQHRGWRGPGSDTLYREAQQVISDAVAPSHTNVMINIDGNNFGSMTGNASIADQELQRAATMLVEAISAFEREHRHRGADQEAKEHLANMLQTLGQLNSKARYADGGGIIDPTSFPSGVEYTPNGDMKLAPSFLGMISSSTLQSNLANSKIVFDQARSLIGNNLGEQHLNLLWDQCFTEYGLRNWSTAISIQKQLIDIYQKQEVPDAEALAMSHDNLGRMYLSLKRPDLAVPEIKKAIKIDKQANKIGASEHTDLFNRDLAFGFMSDGKFSDAAKVAQSNIDAINARSIPLPATDPDTLGTNSSILSKSFRMMGKTAEADAVDAAIHRSGLNAPPLP